MMAHNSVISLPNAVLLALAAALASVHFYRRRIAETSKRDYIFVSGILLIVLTAVLPGYFEGSLPMSVRMSTQVVLMLVVPPLLLSGANVVFLERIVNNAFVDSAGRILFRPVVAWMAGIAAMWIWNYPELAKIAAGSPPMRTVEELSFIALGTVFIRPVFGPPGTGKLQTPVDALYLFSACVGCTVLGIAMTFAPNGWFYGPASSIDRQVAGLIMWVPACLVYAANIVISLFRWYGKANRESAGARMINAANAPESLRSWRVRK
jgi:putative membrane protein